MSENAVVARIGMTPFVKAGEGEPFDTIGADAARRALADAELDYTDVQRAYAGYMADMAAGSDGTAHNDYLRRAFGTDSNF